MGQQYCWEIVPLHSNFVVSIRGDVIFEDGEFGKGDEVEGNFSLLGHILSRKFLRQFFIFI